MVAPTIKTATFEGPIELLLRLIEDRKLPINEISLAEVTESYIAHIRSLSEYPLGYVTQFLVIASTLILIKSKSLLPMIELSDEEEESIEDLEERLRLYKMYGDMGVHVLGKYGSAPSLSRSYIPTEILFVPDEGITLKTIEKSLLEVFAEFPEREPLPEREIQAVVHIEDLMNDLTKRIEQGVKVSFRDMTKNLGAAKSKKEYQEAKTYAVVGFLAMLEMVKNGIIDVLQDQTFTDIAISKRS